MANVRSFLLAVALTTLTLTCSSGPKGSGADGGALCGTQSSRNDAGQPATITVHTSAVVNTFVPKLLFGNNVGWYMSRRDLEATQAKVQAAGNYFLRYPGGSDSDNYHWNGTGNYDSNHYWVSDPTSYTPGFAGIESFRGTTSSSYQTPAFITDGDPTTRWLSNANTTSPAAQWASVSLGEDKTVDAVTIVWGTPFATSFRIETWNDRSSTSSPWQITSAGTVAGTGGVQTVTFDPVTTSDIRVLMTASSAGPDGAYSIAELTAWSGGAQVTVNVASMSQSPTRVSSTDPASYDAKHSTFDFETFMTYSRSFSPTADSIITVNVGTGTVQEAVAWVHYANIVKGYGIRYWEIGNEMDGDWETGGPLDAQDYVNRYIQYYDAMKAEDPTIVVLGPVSASIGFVKDFIDVLDARGQSDHVDGIDFH